MKVVPNHTLFSIPKLAVIILLIASTTGCASIERDWHRYRLSESTSSSSFGYHMRRLREIDGNSPDRRREQGLCGRPHGLGFGGFMVSC